jgi:DNA-binding MarR family transcriptional regulator
VGKREFYEFYSKKELNNHKKSAQDAVHKSIERLVEKDLLAVYGHKTAKRWFIHKAKITSRGKKIIRELIKKRQRRLPIE